MTIARGNLPRPPLAKKSELTAHDIRAIINDPAIRNFIGLADYAWDFNAPDTIPGFGTLPAQGAGPQR
jgi:hypothetical protein